MSAQQPTAIDYSRPGTERELAYAQLFRTVEDLHHLLREREKAYDKLLMAQRETLYRLALAAEYKDGDTGVHLVRIGEISAMLGHYWGLDDDTCETLRHAAPMHDVGKIGIPDAVLKKPGALTPDEWAVMRQHPAIGARILGGSDVPVLQLSAEVAQNHHERFDGSGYPTGAKGKEIPVSARIVSLADYFDALTMDRCYRPKFSDDEAHEMIRQAGGTHFDPDITRVFLDHWPSFVARRDEINRAWGATHTPERQQA